MAFGVTRDPISGAVRANAAASGAKRYGAGQSARATSGPVDPLGYQEREMRKQARRRADQRRMAQMAGGSAPLGAAQFGASSSFAGR